MELALSLEKLTNERLLALHSVKTSSFSSYQIKCPNVILCLCLHFRLDEQQVADRNNDPEMQDFIEREFLAEQVNWIILLTMKDPLLIVTL